MSALLAGGFAAVAVLLWVGLPRDGAVRLGGVLGSVQGGGGPSLARRPVRIDGRLVTGAAGVVALLVVGAVPALLVAGTVLAVRRARGARAAAARLRNERARAVEACGALAGELRAGRSPAEALDVAGELAVGASGRGFAAGAAAARLGGDVAVALQPTPDSAVPALQRSLAVCWTVCADSGAGLAAAVERLEQGLRAEAEQRRAVDAELAGPKATAGLLAVLPVAGLLLATALGADPVETLLHTPVGLVCLVLGVLLDGLGLWWTGRLVAAAGGR